MNAIVDAISSDKPKIIYKTIGAGMAIMMKGFLSDKMMDNVMENVREKVNHIKFKFKLNF